MALIYKIPVETTGPYAGLLRKITKVDPRESSGSLVLIAPGHVASPTPLALPAANTNQNVTNLFQAQAKALLPAASEYSLQPVMQIHDTYKNNSKGKVEYTAKNGIHGIVSKAATHISQEGVDINLGSALRQYFVTNRTHKYYVSLWSQTTRAATGQISSNVPFGAGSTSPDYAHFVMMATGGGQFHNRLAEGYTGTTPNLLGGPTRKFVAGSGKADMVATTFNNIGPGWGTRNAYNAAITAQIATNSMPSWIFYEFFVEDLTVSGRTHQEVDALDKFAFDAAFAPGGRYYGDTFTDPATLP